SEEDESYKKKTAAIAALLGTAAAMHVELCRGQGMEFEKGAAAATPEACATERFALKTGKAFEAALAFGLHCAGAHDAWHGFCADFCRHLGIAFQLRDDLADAGGHGHASADSEAAYRHHRDTVAAMIRTVGPLRFRLLLSQLYGRILPHAPDAGSRSR
ncbi:MAG: polyprenyl synthetase family protein, partial [Kiritimatiellaeota bacterium]|nr:polyprenyl synthetase family protein [Kiritimatiellota bacterium]